MRNVLLALLFLLPGLVSAQGRLLGVVQDSVTHQPLAFASVFLANTTLGTTTTEQGIFELPSVPAGSYRLVASYVGYRLAKQQVVVAATNKQLILRLAPSANQLGEVVVRPRGNRPSDYQKFKDLFIGRTTFSSKCRILNPQDILVDYDAKTDKLTASAIKYIEIENNALGYHLKYYRLRLSSSFAQQIVTFYGQPVFEAMTPRNKAQQQRWATNRLTAYHGSLTHFFWSVYENRVAAEGFRVQKLRLVPRHPLANRDSLHSILRRQRRRLAEFMAEEISLPQWAEEPRGMAVLYLPSSPIDSLRRQSADKKRVFLRFSDYLQVTYLKEGPDPNFRLIAQLAGSPVQAEDRQVSRLALLTPEVEIEPNGQLANSLAVFADSYWGFEKMGEFLPFNYSPLDAATQ